jgi:large subunit ribosomal protein L16
MQPKKTKYKKVQKHLRGNRVSSISVISTSGSRLYLKSLSSGRLTSKQIIAFKFCVKKYLKRFGRLCLFIFPHTPVTKKPLEVRMGKGKGSVDRWECQILSGTIFGYIETNCALVGIKAFLKSKIKLPLRTKIIT